MENGGGGALLVHFFLIIFVSYPVVCQFPGFYWGNEYLVKPERGGFKIPVIEGENVTVQCFVRVNRGVEYEINWDYEGFNATNTNTSIVGDVGAEHAVSNLTVYIDKPADIDDKKIYCLKENGETIVLQFKVFVHDSEMPCGPCNGTEQIQLRRFENRKTEDEDLQKALEKKLIQKQNGAYLCGCKKKHDEDYHIIIISIVAPLVALGLLTFFKFKELKDACLYWLGSICKKEDNSRTECGGVLLENTTPTKPGSSKTGSFTVGEDEVTIETTDDCTA